MEVADAQRELRETYLWGSIGQLVSGVIWLASAAATTWHGTRSGILVLVVGGAFIFPLTQLLLKAMGRPAALPAENPLKELAIEVALVGPLMLPLIGAATLYRGEWFYPAFMVAIGAHYLPFSFLYGMREFIALAVLMVVPGVAIALYAPGAATLGAWLTGALLIAFAAYGWRRHRAH